MLKLNELRPGNWLVSQNIDSWGDNYVFMAKVSEVHEDSFGAVQYTHNGNGVVYSDAPGNHEFKPIQIKSGFAERIGLDKGVNVNGNDYHLAVYTDENDQDTYHLYINNERLPAIYFVHQLQNQFFYLSFTEIAIKLEDLF
ncbi:hypothetical protein [Pedobacter sp. Leaf170]|uniref:hypothetical protein n=1 Tax=Pedobacter sp. Leaf170 TaxID=2876558 RepID=UPI001E5F1C81|nr:hypothetical protein [Pedobacter sp. Leaf170]